MTRRIVIFLLAALCATAPAQTIRTLAYNISNNVVIGATNANALTFSNSFAWSTNTLAAVTRTNLGLGWTGLTNTNASAFRSALDLSANWLTNTNVTNFRAAVGLSWAGLTNTNANSFRNALELSATWLTNTNANGFRSGIGVGETDEPTFLSIMLSEDTNSFTLSAVAGVNRTNLQLPLSALTNESNASMMRALSGSTNTNHPFSGSISVTGTNNTNTLVFSNGILQSVQ